MNQYIVSVIGEHLLWSLLLLPTLLLIWAVILRVACWSCSVAIPPYLYSLRVVFLTWLLVILVSVVANLGIDFAAAKGRLTDPQVHLAEIMLGLPLQLVLGAGMYGAMLKVGFAKGVLIRMSEIFISIMLGLVV
jgi:hypothetical protein